MRNKHWMGILPLALFLLPQTSCVDENLTEKNARRTVLVYMGGDNNLAAETEAKLHALSSDWNHPDSHLIVYQDQGSTSRLLEITAQGPIVIHTYPAENSASKETLRRVVRDMMLLYPADNYGLLVFSHGTGWLPKGTFTRTRTVLADKSSDSEMELADFSDALSMCHFQFIIFEACLMAGIEVAWELQDKTDYVVASASEMLSPGFTDIYPSLREHLFLPEPDLSGFAQTFYEHWNAQVGFERTATISVIRTAAMRNLADAIYPIWNNPKKVSPEEVVHFDNSKRTNLYSDLGDYLRLKAETEEQYAVFEQALEQTVIYRAATAFLFNRALKHHSGFSVYLPHSEYPLLNEAYQRTLWARQMNL